MSLCPRHYREPDDAKGEHDCPHCGLTPEARHIRLRCPGCDKSYTVLFSEADDHDCPHCGLTPEERERWLRDEEECENE